MSPIGPIFPPTGATGLTYIPGGGILETVAFTNGVPVAVDLTAAPFNLPADTVEAVFLVAVEVVTASLIFTDGKLKIAAQLGLEGVEQLFDAEVAANVNGAVNSLTSGIFLGSVAGLQFQIPNVSFGGQVAAVVPFDPSNPAAGFSFTCTITEETIGWAGSTYSMDLALIAYQ